MFKKLYLFILKSFLPLFAMTFCIVLFIVLMQFLWRYIDDLVGKGLELSVLAELFGYAAVTMVPTALPLAILLASLMTFGNLGEKFELTAMKSSGISLMRVMRPLIVFISLIAVGAFFFQDYILPKAQVKMWTLLFSMKQKSPELEIPEGVFYDQITGYNLHVGRKDHNTGMLYDVMIYDVSKGGENATVMRADSARLAFTKGMDHLYLHMWHGEQFENLSDQTVSAKNTPFRRESYLDKEIMISFDANFNRLDDNTMRKQYVGKNIRELRFSIDSISERIDSIGTRYEPTVLKQQLAGVAPQIDPKTRRLRPITPVQMPRQVPDPDSLFKGSGPQYERQLLQTAQARVRQQKQEYEFKAMSMADDRKILRRHQIELEKKFTLSVACLVFFFIGAPLGAIIRKGGIGTPLVISVLLFCFYYVIDNTGYKMARDGHWPIWEGMWLSTAILAPLGGYVTYKAMNDSAVFNPDAWRIWWARISRKMRFRVLSRWARRKLRRALRAPIYIIRYPILIYRSGKGIPVLHYARCLIGWLRPRRYLQMRRRQLIASVQKRPDREYILNRVDYYCRCQPVGNREDAVGTPFTFGSRKHMGSRYFCDLSGILRYFPRDTRFVIHAADVWKNPEIPTLIKARRILEPGADNAVLLNMDSLRLMLNPRDNIPFEEKKPLLLFRGECSGKPHRYAMLEKWAEHPLCDLGDTGKDAPSRFRKQRISIPQHFQYRYILVFEGNDVASSQQWVMASNCVPVMTRPKVDGWFMQCAMQPGVHYIEVADDYSDLATKLEWYEAHPEEARKIAEASTEWARQFMNRKRELIIALMTVEKMIGN